jgi:hypothetical protein
MRMSLRWALTVTAVLCGCGQPPAPPPPAAPPFRAVVPLKQLMEQVIDPAADVIWDSVKTIITQTETKEIAPHTDAEWTAVRNAAVLIAESGNLLLIDGRARDTEGWIKAAKRLTSMGEAAMKAAESKSAEAVFNAGGDIYSACKACHERYAPQLQQGGDAPAGQPATEKAAADKAAAPKAVK